MPPASQYLLGQRLFFDKSLSRNGALPCSSFHQIDNFGIDSNPYSIGSNGVVSSLNTPTIFNLKFNNVFFMDGRASELTNAVGLEIINPMRFGVTWDELISKVRMDETYVKAFQNVYEVKVNKDVIISSLVAYINSLVLPGSKFDRYRNKETTLSYICNKTPSYI